MLKEKHSMMRKILIRGADINFRNREGKSALHIAVEHRLKESTIRFLLANGANPHFEDM